jgi:hypothetical protein
MASKAQTIGRIFDKCEQEINPCSDLPNMAFSKIPCHEVCIEKYEREPQASG